MVATSASADSIRWSSILVTTSPTSQTGRLGGTARGQLLDLGAGGDGAVAGVTDRGPEHRVGGGAGVDDLLRDPGRGVDRDREADTDRAGLAGAGRQRGDRGVDADDLPCC